MGLLPFPFLSPILDDSQTNFILTTNFRNRIGLIVRFFCFLYLRHQAFRMVSMRWILGIRYDWTQINWAMTSTLFKKFILKLGGWAIIAYKKYNRGLKKLTRLIVITYLSLKREHSFHSDLSVPIHTPIAFSTSAAFNCIRPFSWK